MTNFQFSFDMATVNLVFSPLTVLYCDSKIAKTELIFQIARLHEKADFIVIFNAVF